MPSCRLLCLVLFVAACGGKSAGSSGDTAAPCDTVAANIVAAMGEPVADEAQLRADLSAHCVSEAWSEESVSCFAAKHEQTELQECGNLLSGEQQESLGLTVQTALGNVDDNGEVIDTTPTNGDGE